MTRRSWLVARSWLSLAVSMGAIRVGVLLVGAVVFGARPGPALAGGSVYAADVESACAQIKEACADLLKAKRIDWRRVTRQFRKEARGVTSDKAHLALLVRLVARLEDGHAAVRRTDMTHAVPYPGAGVTPKGPGMFLCRVGKKLYVKNAWSSAAESGIAPGMEIVKIEGHAAGTWLAARLARLREGIGFSTDQHAECFALHEGLAEPRGTRVSYVVRAAKGKSRTCIVACDRASFVASGPAFPPKGLQGDRDVAYGKTAQGFGYIHYRRCRSSMPYRTDDALQAIGPVPGMILDFRANRGGGFSHTELLGRFVPPGRELKFQKRYGSRGEASYGGPVVVIVDGATRSAAETASGMFKEDGRAYMIGESPTAGMSSSKKTLELPSAKFQLYVSVRSHMGRYNGGRGIEGVGVLPHEVVSYAPADLAAGRDTLIERAEALLTRFPQKKVPYDPARYGWKAP